MKKIIVLCLVVLFSINVAIADMLSEVLKPCNSLLERAQLTNNADDYIEAYSCGYKIKKYTLDKKTKTDFNNYATTMIVVANVQRYELTKDKKYLKNAHKWAKIAVRDSTTSVETIKTDIVLSSLTQDLKEMALAFDLLNTVNREEAQNYKNDYLDLYDATRGIIEAKTIQRKQRWVNAMKRTVYALSLGLTTYGNSVQQYNMYNSQRYNHSSTTCSPGYGGSINCDSFKY